MIWNLVAQENKWQPKKNNNIKTWLNRLPNKLMGIFENDPSIGWVHPESTHLHIQ